jgi:hypothetical protein
LYWVKNTGNWHILHSYRVAKDGWPFLLTVDGFVFPAGSSDIRIAESTPKGLRVRKCQNCSTIAYHLEKSVEVPYGELQT